MGSSAQGRHTVTPGIEAGKNSRHVGAINATGSTIAATRSAMVGVEADAAVVAWGVNTLCVTHSPSLALLARLRPSARSICQGVYPSACITARRAHLALAAARLTCTGRLARKIGCARLVGTVLSLSELSDKLRSGGCWISPEKEKLKPRNCYEFCRCKTIWGGVVM